MKKRFTRTQTVIEEQGRRKMMEFLRAHEYKSINDQKKVFMSRLFSPLHLAVCTNNLEMVEILLRNNADHNLLDKFGRTPLQLGQYVDKNGSHYDVMEELMAFDARFREKYI